MSSNYAYHHANHSCSADHIREHHTPGYRRDGVDDANLNNPKEKSSIPPTYDHPSESSSESPTKGAGSSKSGLRPPKPSGEQQEVLERSQQTKPRQSISPSQTDEERVPGHLAPFSRLEHRPHNEPGEPGPMDRVVGLVEEFAGLISDNPSLEKQGELRFSKGLKQD